MKNRNLSIVLLGSLGLGGACGSSDGVAMVTAPGCTTPGASGCKVFVDDPASFVRWAGPVTDGPAGGASSAVVKHTPGTLCMSGSTNAGPSGAGWGALLHVGLIDVDETNGVGTVVAPLNAAALGIKQVQFTIDNLPLTGVLPQATQLQSADCKTIPACVLGFSLTTDLAAAGKVTIPLAAFAQADADHPGATLDPTLITGLQFYVPPAPGTSTPYDFCLRDLVFLGSDGNEVKP